MTSLVGTKQSRAHSTSMNKISILFFDDREVRAIWDEENNKWWFSVLEIVAVLGEYDDYEKARNYWKYLKAKLKIENHQIGSATTQFKIESPDGKIRQSNVLDNNCVITLATHFSSNKAIKFLDWFIYSDNSIDGQSKKKAYIFFESNLVNPKDIGTSKCLQQIHAYIFGGLYDFARKIRQKNISKDGFQFAVAYFKGATLQQIEQRSESTFEEIVDKYIEMNIAHPFMEGNGRSTRIWFEMILKKRLKKCVDWSKINKNDYLNAMVMSAVKSTCLKNLLKNALTDEINRFEMFMKGIDYSYYYEEKRFVLNACCHNNNANG